MSLNNCNNEIKDNITFTFQARRKQMYTAQYHQIKFEKMVLFTALRDMDRITNDVY